MSTIQILVTMVYITGFTYNFATIAPRLIDRIVAEGLPLRWGPFYCSVIFSAIFWPVFLVKNIVKITFFAGR